MICDNCRNTITETVVERKDGEKWCHKCAVKEKRNSRRKVTPVKDPFISLARKISKVTVSGRPVLSNVFLRDREGKRVYTNGQILFGEIGHTPKEYKVLQLDTLWDLPGEKFDYPLIEKVIDNVIDVTNEVMIPEEFYTYAEAFGEPKPKKGEIGVEVRQDGLFVYSDSDSSLSMAYQEFSAPLIEPVSYDYLYFMLLQPRKLIQIQKGGRKPAYITSSYAKGIETCSVTMMMPMDLSHGMKHSKEIRS
jgi:hypothetical protein